MKRIIALLLMFNIITMLVPWQAIAVVERTAQYPKIHTEDKRPDEPNPIAKAKNKIVQEQSPIAEKTIEVQVNEASADDYVYGHSVIYNLLKKVNRLDLLGKTMKEIRRAITKETITEKTGQEIIVPDSISQAADLPVIDAPQEIPLPLESETVEEVLPESEEPKQSPENEEPTINEIPIDSDENNQDSQNSQPESTQQNQIETTNSTEENDSQTQQEQEQENPTQQGSDNTAQDKQITVPDDNPQEPADNTQTQENVQQQQVKQEEKTPVSRQVYKTNRFIIKYNNGQKKQGRQDLTGTVLSDIGGFQGNSNRNQDLFVTGKRTSLEKLTAEIKRKEAGDNIEYIQPDYPVSMASNDTYYEMQWGVANQEITGTDGNTYRIDANVVPAWDITQGDDVIVAVIDTGIDTAQEDLMGNIIDGWNFLDNNDKVYNPADNEMHGTNIAGIIAAVKDNNKGLAGAAPAVKIMPLKVFRNGTAYTSDIINAIDYAGQHGAKIVNCSWGMSGENPALQEAMADSDLLFVCAAGNSGKDIDINPVAPASFIGSNIISVGALAANGQLSSFSNYGIDAVDIAAPGQNIVTTAPGNNYVQCSGTSMSAAFVSAEAALLLSQDQWLSSGELRTRIINSSDRLSSLTGKISDSRKLNITNALNGVFPAAGDIINVLPGEQTGPNPDEGNEFMQLYTYELQQKAWYNTLVGPSTANNVSDQKYSVWGNLQELVSPQTGDLTLKQTDIHLPGRNGLDLEIGRIYQSNLALFGDRRAAANGTAYNDYSTYLQNRYGLGVGWSFNLPSVQVEEDEGVKERYYHTGSGPVYHVKFTDDNTDSNLEDYYKKDAVFDNDTTYTNEDGVVSQYVFKTADKTKRYFAADGRLLAIMDRFDNEIKFRHIERQASNIAPNNDFTYSETQGIWTMGGCVSYNSTEGKDDTNSIKYEGLAVYHSGNAISSYIPVLPNTKYILSGYIKKIGAVGGLRYREYNNSYGEINIGTTVGASTNFLWEYIELPTITTSANTKYIRIEFANSGLGTSYLDKVRFDRAWPFISEITDSIGRTVNFSYTDNLYDDTSSNAGTITVTVHAPLPLTDSAAFTYTLGKKTIVYNLSNWQEERRFPYLITSNNGETDINYVYEDRDILYYFTYKNWQIYFQQNKCPVLTEMDLRNSRVKYEYEQTRKHMGDNGYYDTYRIISRYEEAQNDTGYLPGQNYRQTYSYSGTLGAQTYNNETGFPCSVNLLNDPSYFFTTTMQQSNGLKTETTYKGKYEYKTTKYHMSDTSGEQEISTIESYDTIFLNQPTKVKLETVNSSGTKILYRGYTYNDWGGLAKETKPLTQVQWDNAVTKEHMTTTYTYEANYKFLSSKRYYQSAHKVLLESTNYDSTYGRITSKTNSKGETTQYQYDAAYLGNITQITANLEGGQISRTDYDYTGTYNAYPTTITNYYTSGGIQQTSVTQKSYEFIRGQVTQIQTAGTDNTTIYTYDGQGRLTDVTYPASTGQDGTYVVKDHYVYSDVNLIERNNQAAFNVNLEKTKTLTPVGEHTSEVFFKSNNYYDDHGNLLVSQYFDFDPNVNSYETTNNGFNDYGQVTWLEDARNNQTIYDLDEWNRLQSVTDAQGNQQVVEYDIYNRTKLTYFLPYNGAAENHYKEAYDQWGRMISRIGYPDGYGASNVIEEKYDYDLTGNMVKLTDANNKDTLFQYDALNRLKAVVNALGEKSDYDYNRLGNLSSIKQYEGSKTFTTTKLYDERGLLVSSQQPDANPTTFQYNALGQLTQVTDPMSKITTMDYDDSGRLTQKNVGIEQINNYYSPLGGIEKFRVWTGGIEKDSLSYTYTSAGQVKQRIVGSNAVNFQYDVAGNRTLVTDPFGLSTDYGVYDTLNRVTTITVGSKTFTYEYYGDGMIKSVTYPSVGGQTLKTTYTYDNINRLMTITNTKGTSDLSKYTYTYDNNGNILVITDKDNLTDQYEYDALNRLTKIIRSNGENIQYSYDTRGNRVQEAGVTVDKTDFIPGDFSYNDWDELKDFKNTTTDDTYTYEYDAEGLRIKKTAPGANYIRYHYDNSGRVIAESNAGGVIAQNIWGHKILSRKIGSNYYYYLYNGHGDVVQIVNESGNVVNTYRYDEWGNTLEKTEGISNPIRYAGEYYDEESGLYYLRARYYDPTIGRFITKDSYEGDITNPLSINQYAYCYSNPLGYIDPSGHEAVGLRASVEESGGTIDWDPITRTATATVNGITKTYDTNTDSGIYINEYGRIVVDSDRFTNDFTPSSDDSGWDSVVTATKKLYNDVQTGMKIAAVCLVAVVASFYIEDTIYRYRWGSDSSIKWPSNGGFKGTPQKTMLEPGARIDRYGLETGKYASPQGTPYNMRSLPRGANKSPYNAYEVVKPVEVNSGEVAPWFGKPGGGIQFKFNNSTFPPSNSD